MVLGSNPFNFSALEQNDYFPTQVFGLKRLRNPAGLYGPVRLLRVY